MSIQQLASSKHKHETEMIFSVQNTVHTFCNFSLNLKHLFCSTESDILLS